MFKKFPQCPKTREVAQRAECSLHSAGSVRTSSPEVPVSSIQYPVSRVQRPKCRSPVSSVQRIRRLVEVEELTNHKDPIAGLPSPIYPALPHQSTHSPIWRPAPRVAQLAIRPSTSILFYSLSTPEDAPGSPQSKEGGRQPLAQWRLRGYDVRQQQRDTSKIRSRRPIPVSRK